MNIQQEFFFHRVENELHWAQRVVLSRTCVGLRRATTEEESGVYAIFYRTPTTQAR